MPSFEAVRKASNRSLPEHVVGYLKAWLHNPQHVHHPFPTDDEKKMMQETGLDLKRLNNWFVNYHYRHWKPQMEAAGKIVSSSTASSSSTSHTKAGGGSSGSGPT